MKIGYSKTYPVSAYWEKNWLEDEVPTGITLDSTDEEIEAIMKKVRRIQYALKKQVESFHYEALAAAEKQMGTRVVEVQNVEEDKEWEKIKFQLGAYRYKEDAEMYLAMTDYRMTVEAKQIINLKPSKNEKK